MRGERKLFPWPKDYEGAISLTFDDGMPSQLTIAAPLLNDYKLCGTFYLIPRGNDWIDRLAPWQKVAKYGHEIGNHSLSHMCSSNFGELFFPGLENASLKDIESDIVESQQRLQKAFPSQKKWTFAYPCYQSFVGRGKGRQSYVPIVANYFVAARGLGEGVAANLPSVCDLHFLWSWPAQRMSGAEMIGLVEQAVSQGRWGIFTFHGINEGHLPTSEFDLKEILSFLDRNRDRIWTAPVIQIAQYISKRRTYL